MPYADNDGVSIHYEVAESDAPDAETVVLLADAGHGPWLWSWQYPALAGHYDIVVPSTRGTGESDAPGRYSVGEMTADLDAVLSDSGARTVHLVGAGMGGMVALRYALDYSRARSLTLLGTSSGGPRAEGVPADVRERLLVGDDSDALRASLEPAASEELLETDDLVERIVEWRLAEDAALDAQRGHFDAMANFDVSDRLYEITTPALVLHGEDDRVIPVADGRLLAEGLPKGEFRAFPGEHLFFAERSKEVNDALVGFLEAHAED
ncbi:alpha/beta fold hydrolase [Halorussus amylolyticus]|uniref:alpha/beta fold hydrolase n=1 Tax=Halorussus amylolyticus TaxID=1126242 RepID=UPI00104E33F0|nr:alpha/beta hydrolase [Halorussus amylolyticus]